MRLLRTLAGRSGREWLQYGRDQDAQRSTPAARGMSPESRERRTLRIHPAPATGQWGQAIGSLRDLLPSIVFPLAGLTYVIWKARESPIYLAGAPALVALGRSAFMDISEPSAHTTRAVPSTISTGGSWSSRSRTSSSWSFCLPGPILEFGDPRGLLANYRG